MGAVYNHRKAAYTYCQPKSIYVVLDGDDGISGTQTFQMLNAVYQSRDVWFVYTNCIVIRDGSMGYSRALPLKVVEDNNYRDLATNFWITSHMRTFYTQLMLSVPVSYTHLTLPTTPYV